METVQRITLEEVKNAKPENIWYAINSCWWTHEPKHLSALPDGTPCDPRGSILEMTAAGGAMGFLALAEKYAEQYGKHGIRAFMAAHHLNCIESSTSLRPSSASNWDEYNDAIDRFKAKLQNLIGFAEMTLKKNQDYSGCRKDWSKDDECSSHSEN